MKIGELARAVGVTTSRIRFYEERGVIPHVDRANNGYRDYPTETLELLKGVMLGQSLGFSLAQIKMSITAEGIMPTCDAARVILEKRRQEIGGQIRQLTMMRKRLDEMIEGPRKQQRRSKLKQESIDQEPLHPIT